MPILEVELVGPVSEHVREGLARRLADLAGQALDSRPRGTWVRLRFLDEDLYSENAGGPLEGVRPVLVSVLQAEPTQGRERVELAARLTDAIALACDRPAENVHLIFEAPGAGRVSFGGKLQG